MRRNQSNFIFQIKLLHFKQLRQELILFLNNFAQNHVKILQTDAREIVKVFRRDLRNSAEVYEFDVGFGTVASIIDEADRRRYEFVPEKGFETEDNVR